MLTLRLTAGSTCRKAFVFADVSQTPPEGGVCFYGAHGMTQTIQILRVLDGMTPPAVSAFKTPFEQWTDRGVGIAIATCIDIVLTAFLFGLLYQVIHFAFVGSAAVGHWPDWLQYIAAILATVLIVFPFVMLILSTAAAFLSFRAIKRYTRDIFFAQVESDAEFATTLRTSFREKELAKAKACLELKITRNRNRIGLFLGSPDKAALIVVAGAGWAAVNGLTFKLENLFTPGMGIMTTAGFMLALAAGALTGMACGAVGLNLTTHRYVYQLELVTLALTDPA